MLATPRLASLSIKGGIEARGSGHVAGPLTTPGGRSSVFIRAARKPRKRLSFSSCVNYKSVCAACAPGSREIILSYQVS